MLRLVELRYDKYGKSYMAFQGQTDAEALEMNRKYREDCDKAAARIFERMFKKAVS